jgi:malonate-semialdehyde dehydrogenase (acetylating)/methylmalonate-semialdehyde dehydrogenase
MTSAQPSTKPVAQFRTDVATLHNFIGGGWTTSRAEQVLEDRDPAGGELLAFVPLSTVSDVDSAVTSARRAQPDWGLTPVLERARAVQRLRDVLAANHEELARLVTRDMGKTLDEARGEVRRGIESVEAASAVATMVKGESLEDVASGVDVELIRQPVGVVAAITPFNFPAMIPLWFMPFAIATGNSVVLKPSERDPLPAEHICELVSTIDEIPDGVLNLVHGAHDTVNGLLDHPGVDAISFVGRASTARYIASRASEHGKRVQALGGAKNSFVWMPDADVDSSLAAILSSAFGAGGQRCLAGSVLVLVGTDDEQERALDRVLDGARRLRLGPGSDPSTDVCPLISPDARERVEAGIEQAEVEGSRVLLDGRTDGGPAQTELGATIIEAADPDSTIVREELFGPVLSVVRARNLDQAIEFLNRSRYGNASMIFTNSGRHGREFRFRVEAGMIGVNVGVAAPVAWFPFAGWKDSFEGDLHANGADAFEFYTRKKVVTSRWP